MFLVDFSEFAKIIEKTAEYYESGHHRCMQKFTEDLETPLISHIIVTQLLSAF